MNDEAAETRGPSGPSQDAPASSVPAADPTSADPTSADATSADPTENVPPAAFEPPTEPIGDPPPPPPPGPGPTPPPWGDFGRASFSRDAFARGRLVRPRSGRYVAGVCGALARATNTDPVLWRVLFAVLGILSGVGVLLYLIGWLIIPAEGDSASPIESLLGKGRSGMAPLSIVLLGAAAVLTLAFIVQDGMRTSVLAAAVVLGAILLIKRSGAGPEPATSPAGPAAPGSVPPGAGPIPPEASWVPPEAGWAGGPAGFEPATAEFAATTPPAADQANTPMPPPVAPPLGTPSGGYRPPFAPHGPYAQPPYQPAPFPPARPPRPPKPPRERSKLGRLTFFAVVVVIGVMAVLQMAGAGIAVSSYFAAALITIALGLVVGAWFGRARGLIALALLTTLGLIISTGTESWGGDLSNSVYRPLTLGAVAERYDFEVGKATLDLRDVDFAGQQGAVTATMKLGQLRVLLPPNVDTTATVRLDTGWAMILGQHLDQHRNDGQTVTDLGADGPGGGTLRLDLRMDKGDLEVTR